MRQPMFVSTLSPMSGVRKNRTPTTSFEHSLLANHIQRYFETPDRSEQRAQIVREVLELLSGGGREWTHRSIRLWFNNNRRHYFPSAPRSVYIAAPQPGCPSMMPPSFPGPVMTLPIRPLPPGVPVMWQPMSAQDVNQPFDPMTGLSRNQHPPYGHVQYIAVFPCAAPT
jgi:hypothetical protein